MLQPATARTSLAHKSIDCVSHARQPVTLDLWQQSAGGKPVESTATGGVLYYAQCGHPKGCDHNNNNNNSNSNTLQFMMS